MVDLQCCVNFCCIAKWFSYSHTHTHTHIYSFSHSFPLWFITEYWILFPVLYSRDSLFIHSKYISLYLLIPSNSAGKESACNAGDFSSIPGLGRSPGEGNSYPLQYSGRENSTECIVHGVMKSWRQLSDFHSNSHFQSHILAKHQYQCSVNINWNYSFLRPLYR